MPMLFIGLSIATGFLLFLNIAIDKQINKNNLSSNFDSQIIKESESTLKPPVFLSPTSIPTLVKKVILPTKPSIPTLDPDPLVSCNSKTGTKVVKKSTCLSFTDCPDGYGNYIFESSQDCKKRWNKIGQDLTKSALDLSNAIQESQKLYSEGLKQDQYYRNLETDIMLENEHRDFQNDLKQIQDNTNAEIESYKIKDPLLVIPSLNPSPTMGGAGRMY